MTEKQKEMAAKLKNDYPFVERYLREQATAYYYKKVASATEEIELSNLVQKVLNDCKEAETRGVYSIPAIENTKLKNALRELGIQVYEEEGQRISATEHAYLSVFVWDVKKYANSRQL